jgi:DNA-binding transcriptional LysR family regulator
MDVLQAMTVYRRVVELRGFSAAARDLRLSAAAVSKHVAALEERLRVRLLNRTTRSVAPTPAGAAYYERCVRLLDDLDEAERSIAPGRAEVRGVLRVNVPMAFGQLHVAPLLPELLARWPGLTLDLGLTDRLVDLAEEGVDVVVRIAAALPDTTTLVAHALARARQVLCAAPGYLRRRGVPRQLADVARHNVLVYSGAAAPDEWRLEGPDGPASVAVRGNLRVNNSLVLREALLAGAGLALIPHFYVHEQLARGELREILPDHAAPPLTVHAVYQRQRHLSATVRALIDVLRARFARAPWAMR